MGECIQLQGDCKVRYRTLNHEGKRWLAHRLSFHLHVTEIPRKPASKIEGFVLHTCDNTHCINPDHLYLGTAKDNVHDMLERNKVVRTKWSSAAKASRRIVKHRHDWTGKKLSDATKQKISEKAKQRYSRMTSEQRQAHMRPALSNRWL